MTDASGRSEAPAAVREGRRRIAAHELGVMPYEEALTLQTRLHRARIRDAVGDTLLLLEHPRVVTLGRGAKPENLLVSREQLEAQGFSCAEVGRGGDVTYHGPGQLVAYPILDLSPDREDVRRYVRDLEEIMIRLAADHGVAAERADKMNGAWVGRDKIGAIGVRLSRWVTMHGLALNVTTRLEDFGVIVPCGLSGRGVTSLERELGRREPPEPPPTMETVRERARRHFADVFEAEVVLDSGDPLAGLPESAWAPEPWRDARRSSAG